jgi:hypothetical protein
MGKKAESGDRQRSNRADVAIERDRKAGEADLLGKKQAAPETNEDKLAKQRADWEGMTP